MGGEAAEIDVQAHLEQPKREQHGPHRGRGPLSGGRGRRLVVGPGRARRVDRAAEEAARRKGGRRVPLFEPALGVVQAHLEGDDARLQDAPAKV